MPLSEFKQGSVICGKGGPLRQLSFITKGSAEASFNGRLFRFEKGDAIGLCDLSAGSHSHTYTAVTDITVVTYPYYNFGDLETLLRDNADVANLLVNSMCRQVSDFLKYRSDLKQEVDKVYKSVFELYSKYEGLCTKFGLTPKKLRDLPELTQFSDSGLLDLVEEWINNYYMEIKDLDPNARRGFFYGKPGISAGFIRRSSGDILQVLEACRAYQEYLENISKTFINNDRHDLFALVSELYFNTISAPGAEAAVGALMSQLTELLSGMTGIDADLFQKRLNTHNDMAKRSTGDASKGAAKQSLFNALDIIADYSDCPEETRNKFKRAVQEYTKISDRGGPDDEVSRLRRELTNYFNEIYMSVLIKSLKDSAPSSIIKMFLNFGFVDAALAGFENADYLYSIVDSLKGDPKLGVYTLYEWMTAIYTGVKEPSRNELDVDYETHIREMKARMRFDDKEEARLMADFEGKLRFELENVFPVANRVTSGRITNFCPALSDNNIQRDLETSLASAGAVKEAIDEIRNIDFSAFYRSTMYTNPEQGVSKEVIHVEVLPEVILMPNVGTRGIMWQDIEGRKRTTPARMFMPLFVQNNMKNMLIRLTGEFRWEMCKRMQGVRWNDITDASLTSEFFDYLQFYRTNRDLSADVKSSVKAELLSARNSFKSVFISNYVEWLIYESNGSPRLNRYVRKILITYCPFRAEVRENLIKNPQYTEPLNHYRLKQLQRSQRLGRVIQKLQKSGTEVPKELQDELAYLNM